MFNIFLLYVDCHVSVDLFGRMIRWEVYGRTIPPHPFQRCVTYIRNVFQKQLVTDSPPVSMFLIAQCMHKHDIVFLHAFLIITQIKMILLQNMNCIKGSY